MYVRIQTFMNERAHITTDPVLDNALLRTTRVRHLSVEVPFSFVRLVCRLRKARIPKFQRSNGRVPQASEFHLLCWTRLNCSCSLSYFAPTSRFASSFCLLPKMKSESYGTKAKAKTAKRNQRNGHMKASRAGGRAICVLCPLKRSQPKIPPPQPPHSYWPLAFHQSPFICLGSHPPSPQAT